MRENYLKALNKDTSVDVRQCALAGLSQIIKMIGPFDSLDLFLKPVMKIFKQDPGPLTEKLIKYLREILEGFYIPSEERADDDESENVKFLYYICFYTTRKF